MTAAAQRRRLPAPDAEEVPLCATGALGHALAVARGRWAPTPEDLADAALARVDLHEARWAVQPGRGRATERARAAVLNGVIARIEDQKRAASERDRRECMLSRQLTPDELRRVAKDTGRAPSAADLAGIERAVTELRNLGFDLVEVG